MPPSRQRQWLSLSLARLLTATLHASRLQRRGRRSIVQRPLFWTPEFIELGDGVLIWPGCRIEGVSEHAGERYAPLIRMGDGVTLQQYCHLTAAGQLTIGAGTTILCGALITDIDHEFQALDESAYGQGMTVRPTTIGANCLIGAGARIQAGTTLGKQCIVGTNAVVRGDFPDQCVIAGIPARIVRRYDPASGTWRKIDSVEQGPDPARS